MGGWNTAISWVVLIWRDWFGKPWEEIEQVFRLERGVRLFKTNQLRREVIHGRK